ncbi:hypothetical protein AMTRI_Chr03g51120 [Amborella trichopoda]
MYENKFLETQEPPPPHSTQETEDSCPTPNSAPNLVMGSLEESLRLLNFSLEDLPQNNVNDEAALRMGIQEQIGFELDQEINSQIIHEVLQENNATQLEHHHHNHWDDANVHDMDLHHHHHDHLHHHHQEHQDHQQLPCFNPNSFSNTPYNAPDLLNLLHLPKCSSMPFNNSNLKRSSLDIFGEIPSNDAISTSSSMLYDPLHITFPPQPPLLRDLFTTLPHNYHMPSPKGNGYFGVDEKEGTMYQEGGVEGRQYGNTVLEFGRKNSKGKGRGTKPFTTERDRREYLNKKFSTLRSLVPNPTKADRASIVGDATEYIKELLRTVDELKILVEKKRCGGDRSKKVKTDGESCVNNENCSSKNPDDQTDRERKFNGSLRSSWLQRTSKEGTLVDVRIVDDEANIKLTQRKRRNCLLYVSKILDELQLEIIHVTGANIGDNYIFMFNTKIHEGSCVYASAIASKLMEVVDRQYPPFSPPF